ncbi:MAG: hypothetical protein HY445_00035 [Candidatus Niyogibacteria bacterium]|nr:hypothetical protein [Candidatus Niyogibacteria bacterium]
MAKRIPYLEFIIAITHPLRGVLGIYLVGAAMPFLLLIASFFCVLAIIAVRRRFEKMKDTIGSARSTLLYYRKGYLSAIEIAAGLVLVIIMIWDFNTAPLIYLLLIALYITFVVGSYRVGPIRKIIEYMSFIS